MNQKEAILDSNAPIHKIGKSVYKGKNPVFVPTTNDMGHITGYEKIQKGIPFVLIED